MVAGVPPWENAAQVVGKNEGLQQRLGNAPHEPENFPVLPDRGFSEPSLRLGCRSSSWGAVALVLSRLFLHERFGPLKLTGIAFTLIGVAILSAAA